MGHLLTGDFLRGRFRERISQSELGQLETLLKDPELVVAGNVLTARGDRLTTVTFLLDGFAKRSTKVDGQEHILGVCVPGEFVDLPGFGLKQLDHDVVAIGSVRIAKVAHDQLKEACDVNPGITQALWLATLLDGAIHRKWVENLGGLTAPKRIAHIYAELRHRLNMIGRNVRGVLRTPLSQSDLGGMCGVTSIHINRALKSLRELGLANERRGDVYVDDWEALETYAKFNPAYLYPNGRYAREIQTCPDNFFSGNERVEHSLSIAD